MDDSEKRSAARWEQMRRMMSNPELKQKLETPGEQQLREELELAWMYHERAFLEWKALSYGKELNENQLYVAALLEVTSDEPDPDDEEAVTRWKRADKFLFTVDKLEEILDTLMAEHNLQWGELLAEEDTRP